MKSVIGALLVIVVVAYSAETVAATVTCGDGATEELYITSVEVAAYDPFRLRVYFDGTCTGYSYDYFYVAIAEGHVENLDQLRAIEAAVLTALTTGLRVKFYVYDTSARRVESFTVFRP